MLFKAPYNSEKNHTYLESLNLKILILNRVAGVNDHMIFGLNTEISISLLCIVFDYLRLGIYTAIFVEWISRRIPLSSKTYMIKSGWLG